MDKGANASNGLSITDKKSSSSNSDVAARLVKMHSTEAFLSPSSMTGVHRGSNLDRPFDGGGDGPTGSNAGGGNEALLSNMSRDDVVSSCCGGGENFRSSSGSTNLQPFDIFPAVYSTNPYKSPGDMAANGGFPFTSAQWRELERQAMIYKYMMYSVPVPPDLLLPLTRNFPDSPASALYNMRHSRNGDPEPGRCKRTDGKKWRCAKDVAPHQKYCERHLHRGRPRSRKPVEPKSSNGENHNKKTRLVVSSLSTSQQAAVVANDQQQPLLLSSAKPGAAANNGDLGLVVEAEMVGLNVAEQQQQWQLLMDANMGFASEGSSSICDSTHLLEKDYILSYSNLGAPEINAPPGFIDAWSIDNSSTTIVNDGTPLSMTNRDNVSPSLNLSMTMAVGNILDDEMGKVQLGGVIGSCDGHNSRDLKWLSPVSWEPFAPGGPLAEALQLGSLCANPASPHDSISTPATTVSSPSGVLQRTFFSHSDSSVCNSPTLVAHPLEIPFHRLN